MSDLTVNENYFIITFVNFNFKPHFNFILSVSYFEWISHVNIFLDNTRNVQGTIALEREFLLGVESIIWEQRKHIEQ